ncbi:MAG TPA: type II secretion protein F [Microbacterium sp.]|jgi:tight adherence protein B|uniref:type II secretion system F family protein n=1 Tax=Microbacterium TaxID=33882 RepID=UPI000C6574AD|nr:MULTISPECIES: type II secretion system F family protein [unclassified Microbacterium]MEC8761641.1 type II secretion system F family protein [Actinomycetota bacterium]MBU18824.1 type II secretion protein F [Microbacterium sp.]HBS09629.1 type II secretion protein F [Microbacterium sp.]HBU43322.1 type II secretion protein F [Microbacterium sp.]HIE60693.1 type II secretion protein F [Microbacterium sp.]
MILLVGAMLGAGVLLVLSPWLWPARPAATAPAEPSALARLIGEAGFAERARPRTVLASAVLVGAIAAALVWLVFPTLPLWLLAGVVGAYAPVAWLQSRARRRAKERRGLWPDVCDLLVSSVRAGMSLADAVASLAVSGPERLRPDFVRFARDVSASGHLDAALAGLKARLADPIADRIVETLRMAREVGGTELVPTLRALGASVRADATLRAEVEARQSWIRAAAVLGAVAPWVILGLLALRPEAAAAYGSPQGIGLILGGAVVTVVAFRLMLRVGRLAEPRRWFA